MELAPEQGCYLVFEDAILSHHRARTTIARVLIASGLANLAWEKVLARLPEESGREYEGLDDDIKLDLYEHSGEIGLRFSVENGFEEGLRDLDAPIMHSLSRDHIEPEYEPFRDMLETLVTYMHAINEPMQWVDRYMHTSGLSEEEIDRLRHLRRQSANFFKQRRHASETRDV